MDGGTGTAGNEVFALTDEQIVGLEAGPSGGSNELRQDAEMVPGSLRSSERTPLAFGRDDNHLDSRQDTRLDEREKSAQTLPLSGQALRNSASGQAGMVVAQPPEWLAARMKDPWHGDEAKELWDGKQNAEKEAAAYREVFATPEDARALKEIYPGGVAEARSAAERARTLDDIDAAFYRGDAAARMQLAQKMMAQDPEAFRGMVEAGLRLLNGANGGPADTERLRSFVAKTTPQDDRTFLGAQDAEVVPRSLRSEPQSTRFSGRDDKSSIPEEVVRAYGEMERAANAELEKSVGAAIGRAMELALPNLRQLSRSGRDGEQPGAPLQERLAAAVREEVEAGLKSDRELGEQVARVLSGRRFDGVARGQVVRLIDARARQLVPGAVKRVVGSWTQATLAARGKSGNEAMDRLEGRTQAQNPSTSLRASRPLAQASADSRNPRQRAAEELEAVPVRRGLRVDYARLTDEEILGL